MGRWEPDAQGRLMVAALELFDERGFEQTTVAEIAERAGLTERTFFRYFADKREVLFGGAGGMRELLTRGVAAAPQDAAPLQAAVGGLLAAGELLDERHEFAVRRRRVIAANPELQERELNKLASWARALAEALRARGVEEPRASLSGELAIVAFRVAFERWVETDGRPGLPFVIAEVLEQMRELDAGAPGAVPAETGGLRPPARPRARDSTGTRARPS